MGWRYSIALASALWAQSPHDAVPDVGLGKRMFDSQCALCHGHGGTGGRGPALNRPQLGKAPDDEALRKLVREGLPPEMPRAWQLSVREVASVAAYVKSLGAVAMEHLPGDPGRGAAVYRAKGCSGCHIVAGSGIGRGPELTQVGARRNGAYLRESLVKPDAYVPDGYLVLEVVARDGGTVRGTRAAEDPFTIQVADANGDFRSFRKDAVEIRRWPGMSTMPSFEKNLAATELDDLVAYLASLRGNR